MGVEVMVTLGGGAVGREWTWHKVYTQKLFICTLNFYVL